MFGKEFVELEKRINEELHNVLASSVEELLNKELTTIEIINLIQSGKIEIEKHEDTASGVFGAPYSLGVATFKIVDSVANKVMLFKVKVEYDKDSLDFKLKIEDKITYKNFE